MPKSTNAFGPVTAVLAPLRATAQAFRKGWVRVFVGCILWAFAVWIIWAYAGITGIQIGF